MSKYVQSFKEMLKENSKSKTTQTIFNSDDKRIIRDKMDDILIKSTEKFYDIFPFKKKEKMDKVNKFIDDSMDDLYKTIIDVLEAKEKPKTK